MTGARVGERFGGTTEADCRYFKHATDGALANGDPCDAGSLMIVDQDLSHQAHEGVWHLFSEPGPDATDTGDDPHGYGGLRPPVSPPPRGFTDNHQKIAWGQATARTYGPFNLLLDRTPTNVTTSGGRGFRLVVQTTAVTGSSLQLYAAVTPEGKSPWENDMLASSGWLTVASGTQTTTIDLVPDGNVVRLQRRWRYRSSGAVGNEAVVIPVQLWLGWYSTDDDDAINAINGFESREI
jgi:hypothetical protein